MPFDYYKILKAYINHVDVCEGVDFIPYSSYPKDSGIRGLTEEEVTELRRTSAEAASEWVNPNTPNHKEFE